MTSVVTTWATDTEEIHPDLKTKLKRILMLTHFARCQSDYEFLDKYVHSVNYFSDLPPDDRLMYLRAVNGVELEKGEELFHIGDPADAFYCVMYGSLNVVVDFEYVTAPNLNESDEAINQAKNHSYAMNRDRGIDVTQSTSYVVRTLKALECFGDVGLMTSDQTRTATVVANEKTLLMKIFKDTFVNLRRISDGRELKEKKNFLSNIIAFNHWDRDAVIKLCGRMEKVRYAYNDVVFAEGENAGHFYCVKHGEVRLVKKYPSIHQNGRPCFVEICTVSSGFYFGHFEVIFGHQQAFFSALISSPSATLYRVNRIDFRQTILKDSLTENLMRSECKELKLRIQEDQVKEDLKKDIEWTEFKKNLLDTVIAEHEYNRSLSQKIPNLRSPSKPNTSNMLPKANSLIINKFDLARRPEKTSFSSKSKVAAKPASTRSPRARVASKNSQVNPKWVQWAKERAKQILSTHNLNINEENSEEKKSFKSNIHWSKTAQIMGAPTEDPKSDKITSAIVSMLNQEANPYFLKQLRNANASHNGPPR